MSNSRTNDCSITYGLWDTVGSCVRAVNEGLCNETACKCLCCLTCITKGSAAPAYAATWAVCVGTPVALGIAATPFTLCCDGVGNLMNNAPALNAPPRQVMDQRDDSPRQSNVSSSSNLFNRTIEIAERDAASREKMRKKYGVVEKEGVASPLLDSKSDEVNQVKSSAYSRKGRRN